MNALRLLAAVLWRSVREFRTPASVLRELIDQLAVDLEDLPRDLALSVLPLQPGDVIVATVRVEDLGHGLFPDRVEMLAEAFPDHPVVWLAEGLTLETLSREQLDDLLRYRPPASDA